MAKGIDLGLESLLAAPKPQAAVSLADELSDFFATSMEVMEQANDLLQAYHTLDTLTGIQACIKKYGVTQSLEAMYGENFSSVEAMEEENKAATESGWKKLGAMWKKFVAWLIAWLQKFTFAKGRCVKRLQAIEAKANKMTDVSIKFKGFKSPGAAATMEQEAGDVELTGNEIKSCVVAHYQALNQVENKVKSYNEKIKAAAKAAEDNAKKENAPDGQQASEQAQEEIKTTKSATMHASKLIASANALMAAIEAKAGSADNKAEDAAPAASEAKPEDKKAEGDNKAAATNRLRW